MSDAPPGSPGVQGMLARATDTLRRTGRWQRMRIALLGGWVAASVLALFIACPSRGPANGLGADVQVLKDSILGQQILIRNESDTVWTDVVLTLDGAWRHTERAVRPHEQVVLSPSQFERDGQPAPRDLRPRTLTVQSAAGRARFDLH